MARNLLDLNDDCLAEIFSKLTVPQLGDVACTCIRFQNIARQVFPLLQSKSNGVDLGVGWPFTNGDYIAYQRQIAPILRNFGDLVTKLNVTFCGKNSYNTSVFNLIANYCTGTLERLELRCCLSLHLDQINDANAIFRNVKQLILHRSYIVEGSFLADAKELTELTLTGFYSTRVLDFLSNDYPNLKSITVKNSSMDWEEVEININNFLERHPHLIECHLDGYDFDNISAIAGMPELRKLSIWLCGNYIIRPIAQLDKLTAMQLSANGSDQLEFLDTSRSSETLEELVLNCFLDDGTRLLKSLARFSNLNLLSIKLHFVLDDNGLALLRHLPKLRVLAIGGPTSITADGVINLIRYLPHLQQLSLDDHRFNKRTQMQESTYLRICEIYQNRSQPLTIYNYNVLDDEHSECICEEAFVGGVQQKFVHFIAVHPDYDGAEETIYI